MMANEIDERVVRLRASPEGRNVIEAVERVSARMAAAGKRYTFAEDDLLRLKGINFTDEAVHVEQQTALSALPTKGLAGKGEGT